MPDRWSEDLFDSPFAGGTTWDVAGHTVIGAIEPAMIPVLRQGSEAVVHSAEGRIAEHRSGGPAPWDGSTLRTPMIWRAIHRSVMDELRDPRVDAELTWSIRATHAEFLGQLPASGGVVRLDTAEQVEIWLHALYDHHLLAHEIVGKPLDELPEEPDGDCAMSMWCQHTMSKIGAAADRAKPPRG
ncbi:hypothetical protein FPZ12_007085 [Amycolatopsis acidicola]|uniref:Uncharacterized protein n=1 Tax=Amycolatopsis acidicola TaxID=2596893 RepID=A0A5N0VHU1_9PSEU|nr:hypothetical protein [Amycolatopsis acidicola]KAA9165003.1 hypothetical protein FPZ12_007085 [Amycolatopsis acidicola]